MAECVFCRIAAGAIPAKLVYQDADVIAFEDNAPQAPFHVLVIPRAHVSGLPALEDARLGGRLLQVVRSVAAAAGHAEDFRMVSNNGRDAGQSVAHLHIHVLAGRPFSWPPG